MWLRSFSGPFGEQKHNVPSAASVLVKGPGHVSVARMERRADAQLNSSIDPRAATKRPQGLLSVYSQFAE